MKIKNENMSDQYNNLLLELIKKLYFKADQKSLPSLQNMIL